MGNMLTIQTHNYHIDEATVNLLQGVIYFMQVQYTADKCGGV